MNRIIIAFVFINLVNCSTIYQPHIISQTGSVLGDNAAHKNSRIFSEESQKGITNIQESNGINNNHEVKHVSGQDEGSYNNENSHKDNHQNTGQQEEEKFHQLDYNNQNKIGKKGGQRKGHHKSGYHNTYHKDESENKSSFFDDGNDESGHFEYNSQNGAGAQNGGNRFKEVYDNGRFDNKYDNKKGHYDINGNYGNERGEKEGYDHKNYYNDRRDQRNSNVGDFRGQTGINYQQGNFYKEPNYYSRQPYYEDNYYRQPYYQHYEPKKTITIYDDPRTYSQRYYSEYPRPFQRRYESDYVHLDYRRPVPYRRPFYDYYIYK